MNDNEKVYQSALLISKDFGISQSEFGIETEQKPDYTELLKKLTRVIKYLMDHDFQKLLNGFYRIDVDQSKVSQILEITNSDDIAFELAILVLDRELQKVESRLKYKDQ